MTIIKPGLFLIMQQCPCHKNLLRRMYFGSRSFQILCDDYHKCVEAHEYWAQSKGGQAQERSQEYREMMKGLKNEIKERIRANKKIDTGDLG
ncbi:MAG: hypothetical protein HUK40_10240 [Desulfobacter sp.]|nr:hypothetical protein [Desulfobacter sp.]WDP84504.1 MAG: hypothetical protein HUN05_04540 [Desulfobacter sp.]